MFNDLNNPNPSRPAVDDIFAETDKSAEGAAGSSLAGSGGIDTKRVGLASEGGNLEEEPEKDSGNKWFTIVIIVVIAAIVLLCGYLVYSKFLKASPDLAPATAPTDVTGNKAAVTAPTSTPDEDSGSFVTPASEDSATATSAASEIPQIPGVNAPTAGSASTSVETAPVSQVDSDSDGLNDSEEQLAGTNINIIDTDNDGLSDYEEVKIYNTNPLSADTDGDTYLDGAEVKGGYNPNGTGKLSEQASSSPVVK